MGRLDQLLNLTPGARLGAYLTQGRRDGPQVELAALHGGGLELCDLIVTPCKFCTQLCEQRLALALVCAALCEGGIPLGQGCTELCELPLKGLRGLHRDAELLCSCRGPLT